jgi:hypothetical protein
MAVGDAVHGEASAVPLHDARMLAGEPAVRRRWRQVRVPDECGLPVPRRQVQPKRVDTRGEAQEHTAPGRDLRRAQRDDRAVLPIQEGKKFFVDWQAEGDV